MTRHQSALRRLPDFIAKPAAPLQHLLPTQPNPHSTVYECAKNLLRGEQGQSLVEFGVAASIMFAFMFGLMQVCLAFYSHEYISELAREGTRYAIVHGPDCITSSGSSCEVTATTGTGTYSSVNSYVSAIGLPNLGSGPVTVSTTYPDGEAENEPVVVKVTYAFPYHIPYVTPTTLTMSSTSEMYIIQ
jgi:Flp pilus assembly protein TadG